MTEVKSIPAGAKEFTANNVKYVISEKISANRFKEYEKLVPELTFGLNFQDIFKQLKNAFNFLNKSAPEPANAAIIIHNVMSGIKAIDDEKRVHPALMIASLMINREGEDLSIFDEAKALEKISDWQAEGMDMMSFFVLALNTIEGFRETLTQFTSEAMTKLETEISK